MSESSSKSVQLARAAVALVALLVVLVAVVLWAPRPAPEATSPFPSFNNERDRQLRKANGFLAYIQCPLPVAAGVAEVEGPGALNGPVEIRAGFVEFPAFTNEGVVTIKIPNHRREPLRWHDAVDGQLTSCLPLPDWKALSPHNVVGRLTNADGTAIAGAHLLACGRYVEVDPSGAFSFEGATEPCTVQPFLRRPRSSVVGAPIPYDPEAATPLDLVFEPQSVRLERWQGAVADVEFELDPTGLTVAHAQAPTAADTARRPTMGAVKGLPPGARITRVGDEPCAAVPAARQIELAEVLASANTTYAIVQP